MFKVEFKEMNDRHYKINVGESNIWEYKGDYYNVRYKQLEPEILKILDMSQEEYYSLFNKVKDRDYDSSTFPKGPLIRDIDYVLVDEKHIFLIGLETKIEEVDDIRVEKYGWTNLYVVDKDGNTTAFEKIEKQFNPNEVQDYILRIIRNYLEKDLETAKNCDENRYKMLCSVKENMKIALAKRNIDLIAKTECIFAEGFNITIRNRLDDREFVGLKLDTLKEFINERTTPKKIEVKNDKAVCDCGKTITPIKGMKYCPFCGRAISID